MSEAKRLQEQQQEQEEYARSRTCTSCHKKARGKQTFRFCDSCCEYYCPECWPKNDELEACPNCWDNMLSE